MREEIKCDICDTSLETRNDYKVLQYLFNPDDDEFIRICTPCDDDEEFIREMEGKDNEC